MTISDRELDNVRVAMRDGIALATDVYLPSGTGPFPVLLERTPYNRKGSNHGDLTAADGIVRSKPEVARWFAESGYAFVMQDCRGRFASEGIFTKYVNEAQDGFDTLAWITRQPWCDGRIGTLGLSYGAHTQMALAALAPPGLATMFVDSGGFSSAYHSGARQGGAFELKQLTWAYKHALLAPETIADGERRKALEKEKIAEWMSKRWQIGFSPVSSAPEYERFVVDQWDHACFDDFWRQSGLYARGDYARFPDIPMVHMSSWYDPYSKTAIENFAGLTKAGKRSVRLVLGPWTHGQRSVTYAGDVDFGERATLDGHFKDDYFTFRRAWFDRHLRGLDAPDPLAEPVYVFVMGGGSGRRTSDGRLDHGGQWRSEQTWPPERQIEQRLYLHGDGTLDARTPDADGAPLVYQFDPRDPVPTIGGAIASGAPVMFAGAYDQQESSSLFGAQAPGRPLSARADILIFQTARLVTPCEVTGSVTVELFISSSAVDTDFTIKLVDVYPPSEDYPSGYAMNLAHGILRTRFRNSFEHPVPLQPGEIYRISIESFPTSNLFAAGHRIRLEVSSSNFPHFDVNPNVDWRNLDEAMVVAENVVYVDRDHASSISLPVIPDPGER